MDKETILKALQGIREETYPNFRNKLAEWADLTGGAQSDMSTKEILHGQGNYNLTKKLANVFPPQVAANLSDSAYLGNELFTGTLAKATGRPFFSKYGFSWDDIGINRRAQERALQELREEQTARDLESRELAKVKGNLGVIW